MNNLEVYNVDLESNELIEAVVNKIIEDTSIPKTYRSMFKRYLEWKNEKE